MPMTGSRWNSRSAHAHRFGQQACSSKAKASTAAACAAGSSRPNSLVLTRAGHMACGARRQQARGNLAHRLVAGLVAQQVAHFLQAFEGHQHQHHLPAIRGRGVDRLAQRAAQPVLVGQPGQRIEVGQVGQPGRTGRVP
jgi:hypothetical protein